MKKYASPTLVAAGWADLSCGFGSSSISFLQASGTTRFLLLIMFSFSV